MRGNEQVSYIIFYGHRVWSVPANKVKLVARMTKAAIASYESADKGEEKSDGK
jgi:hypothetical protein